MNEERLWAIEDTNATPQPDRDEPTDDQLPAPICLPWLRYAACSCDTCVTYFRRQREIEQAIRNSWHI